MENRRRNLAVLRHGRRGYRASHGGNSLGNQRRFGGCQSSTGGVSFNVKGLVLAVGSDPVLGPGVPIGTPGPVTEVKGTLVCDVDGTANSGNSVDIDTAATSLDSEGDAQFSGSFVSTLPSLCSSENDDAFVIRIVKPAAFAGAWIAF